MKEQDESLGESCMPSQSDHARRYARLRKEITEAINRNCAENGSDTPDYILGDYLLECLAAYDRAVGKRESWYGRKGTGAFIQSRRPPPSFGPPP